MIRRTKMQRVLWMMEDYRSMAQVIQETAYHLTEIREDWDIPLEALTVEGGISQDTIDRFEELGIASAGARIKTAKIALGQTSTDDVNGKAPTEMLERVERYRALARFIEEIARMLKQMPEEWGQHALIVSRASGVSMQLIEKVERIAARRSPELLRKSSKPQH